MVTKNKIFFWVAVAFGFVFSNIGYHVYNQVPLSAPLKVKFLSFVAKTLFYSRKWDKGRNLGVTPQTNENYTFELLNLTYRNLNDTEDINLEVYHYIPKNVHENSDIIIHIHGGGFTVGNPGTYSQIFYEKLIDLGFIVLSPTYRLCPENNIDDMIQDITETIKWIKETYGEERLLIISGDSAGGALTEINARVMKENNYVLYPKNKLINVDIYPFLCLQGEESCPVKYGEIAKNSLFLDRRSGEAFEKDIRYGTFKNLNLFEDTSNLPPHLILTGEFDPLRNEAEYYHEILKKNYPNHTKHKMFEGECHGFFVKEETWEAASNEIFQFYKYIKDME